MTSPNRRPTSIEAANALALLTAAIENQQQQQQQQHHHTQNYDNSNLSSQSTADILRALGLLPPNSTTGNNLLQQPNIPLIPSPLNPNSRLQQPLIYQPVPTRSGRIPQLPPSTQSTSNLNHNNNNSNSGSGSNNSNNNRDTLLFNEYFDYADYPSSDDEDDLDFNPYSNSTSELHQWDDSWAGAGGKDGSNNGEEGKRRSKRKKKNHSLMLEGDLFSNNEEDDDDEDDEDEDDFNTDFSNYDETFMGGIAAGVGGGGTTTDDGMLGGLSDPGTVDSFYSGGFGSGMDIDIDDSPYHIPTPIASTSTLPRVLLLQPPPTTMNPSHATTTPSSSGSSPLALIQANSTSTSTNNLPSTQPITQKKSRKPYTKKLKLEPLPPQDLTTIEEAKVKKARKPYRKRQPREPHPEDVLREKARLRQEKNTAFQKEKRAKGVVEKVKIANKLKFAEIEILALKERIRELGGGEWKGMNISEMEENNEGSNGDRNEKGGTDSNASWSESAEEDDDQEEEEEEEEGTGSGSYDLNQSQKQSQQQYQQHHSRSNTQTGIDIRIDGTGPSSIASTSTKAVGIERNVNSNGMNDLVKLLEWASKAGQ